MTTRHTPGPWTIDEVVDEPYRAGKYWVAHLNLGHERTEAPWPDATATVAPCLGLSGQPIGRDVIEANAHLIAAAPDLLAALEVLARSFSAVAYAAWTPEMHAAVEVILTENKKDVERLEKASEGYYRKIRPTDLLFKKVKDDDTWSHGVTYLQIQKRELSS